MNASGEFVGLPFHPAVFDFGNGGDVIEPFGGGTRTVSGSAPSATGQTADGRYEYISHAVLVTVGFRF